jgi:uncharacterized membrane protein (DUF485 family)
MKNEIEKNDVKKFNALSWLFAAEFLALPVSIIPLIKYLGWLGGVIWGILFAVTMFTAIKVEKMKKANNIQTYKEIKAFMEGKPLDEISAERRNSIGSTLVKIICGASFGFMAAAICAYLFFI